jgi:Kef-type K+ transport system membrane component KefB
MWWAALAFTLGLMALFQQLTRAGPLEARATLALGFLLLAAHLGGELAKRFRLPRITGFLVTGFAVGPAWLGLVRGDEALALGFISDAAMALIAFGAGSQLTLELLRRDRVSLARLSIGTIVFPLGLVTAVILSVSRWFPLTVHQPLGDALAVALVLGTIAAASSPSLTMALIDELDAEKHPVARAVLGTSIVKDVLVIVLFALVLGNLPPIASAGALDVGVAWATLVRAAGSLAAGVALGYAVSRYVRLLGRDTPLLLVAVAFLTAVVAGLAGLETMLMALAAGFYVTNYAPVEGERLRGELQRGALPVYIVFFALAGAALQAESLQLLMENWAWVLLLVALRALGLRLGTRFAGRSPLVPGDVARHGWLGLVSQAGVALGLGAAARRAFPEWGVSLQAWIVVMIGVHEIVGPICFRRALRLAGEVPEGDHVTEKRDVDGPALVAGGGSV